ncbi:MAG: hypothetical protein OXH39_07425 [Candidatus Poribacteria bacterium]|nr:hypothetical protein [Candidatus Poribacteria bacterium]
MKVLRVFFFCCLSLGLLCSVSAESLAAEKIVFSSNRNGNSEIYIMNPDGSQQVRLTNHRASDINPVFSPTGEEILFVSDRSGERDLYIMRVDGHGERPVFRTDPAYRSYAAWSPDGKKIVYSQHDFAADLGTVYTAKADGTSVNSVVESESAETGDPVWSPDGTEIAYVVHGEINWTSRQIRFIDLKTRKEETLLPDGIPRMWQPAWSSVSNKIAFVWYKPELRQQSIFIVNRDGSGLQHIVDVIVVMRTKALAWSPSGDELVYSQSVGNASHIFKINLVTHGVTQLTHEGSNYAGDWFDPSALPVSPQPQLLTTTWGKIKTE